MYVKHNDKHLGPIARAAFPANRKDISVSEFHGPINVNSYWQNGSRDEYKFVNLETREVWNTPASHPHYDRKDDGSRCGNLEVSQLPPNVALVVGGTFCGKTATVRVLLNPENLAKMIEPPKTLSDDETSALFVIASHKGGYRQDEFVRRGLGSYHKENPAIRELAKKLLVKINKAGAITVTTEGRNAS